LAEAPPLLPPGWSDRPETRQALVEATVEAPTVERVEAAVERRMVEASADTQVIEATVVEQQGAEAPQVRPIGRAKVRVVDSGDELPRRVSKRHLAVVGQQSATAEPVGPPGLPSAEEVRARLSA